MAELPQNWFSYKYPDPEAIDVLSGIFKSLKTEEITFALFVRYRYRRMVVNKNNGTARLIFIPPDPLKAVQRKINN